MDNKTMGNKIFKGTLIIVFVGIFAKFAAFVSGVVLAAYLGTTYQSDAYYMISGVHAVVYPMMSVGIWKIFLPLYKSHITKKENDIADSLTNKSLSFFTTISLVVVLLLFIFAPFVVSVVAPGFEGKTRNLCIKLIRISAPMYMFIIASSVYASMLQCHNKFLGSQIREVASHIPTIIGAIFFYSSFGIEAMAIALVVAGFVRLLIEIPFVDWNYKFQPDFNFKSSEFTLILKRLPSALVSAGVAECNALVDKAMSSMLSTGTVSCLNYGQKLTNVCSGLLSSAISTALYPQMIELIALDKRDELGRLVVKIVNLFCVLMIPVTIGGVLFRIEIVSAVFQRGAFDANSTALTANIFALYCLGLFFIACNTIISNIFYGFGDTKTPMYIGIAHLVINVILNLVFIHFWGVNGLAFATSMSAIITFFIRFSVVRKYIELNQNIVVVTGIKVLLASAIAFGVPRFFFWSYTVNKYLMLVITVIVGLILYLVSIKLLKVRELDDLFNLFWQKMKIRSQIRR